VVSSDPAVILQLSCGMQQFGIDVQACRDVCMAKHWLSQRKFDALIVDLTCAEPLGTLLGGYRASSSNETAVAFAVVNPPTRAAAFELGANFVMEKPLSPYLIAHTFKAALGLIIREHRRYFRCPAQIRAVVQVADGHPIPCQIVNISEGGLAATASAAVKPGTEVKVEFRLTGLQTAFKMDGEICWCDNNGRFGLQFRSVLPEQRSQLQEWLSRKLEEKLPDSVARLFRQQE
jgi:PilZ domain